MKRLFLGLILCVSGSVFGMQKGMGSNVWRFFAIQEARKQGVQNIEVYVDQIASKNAVSSFIKVIDEMDTTRESIFSINSYGEHNKKELDALAKDLKTLQNYAKFLSERLEKIEQNSVQEKHN